MNQHNNIYQYNAIDLMGNDLSFSQFKDKVLLIVNTASECGFTPQLAGLQDLHEQYAKDGLIVIGFPCNQFGKQEPNDNAAIGEFCQKNYGVSFLMMQKIDVNGKQAHPLYVWLKAQAHGFLNDDIKWNFTKFLIGRDGQVINRYAPTKKPKQIQSDIKNALGI